MPDVDSRGLITVGRILSPVGGAMGPRAVDFSSPMPVVFDASRIAEAASGAGSDFAPGYFNLAVYMTHAAADVQKSTFDPHYSVPLHGPVPEEFDVWLIDFFCWCTDPTVPLSGNAAVFFPSYIPGTTGLVLGQLVWQANSMIDITDVTGTSDDRVLYNSVRDAITCRLPMFMPRGTVVSLRTQSSAAGVQVMVGRLWSGPKGVRPPGVA